VVIKASQVISTTVVISKYLVKERPRLFLPRGKLISFHQKEVRTVEKMVLCARVHCVAASWLPTPPPAPQNDGHDGRLSKDSVTQLAGALLSVPRVRSPLLETIAGTATCCLPSPHRPSGIRPRQPRHPSAVRPFVRARRRA